MADPTLDPVTAALIQEQQYQGSRNTSGLIGGALAQTQYSNPASRNPIRDSALGGLLNIGGALLYRQGQNQVDDTMGTFASDFSQALKSGTSSNPRVQRAIDLISSQEQVRQRSNNIDLNNEITKTLITNPQAIRQLAAQGYELNLGENSPLKRVVQGLGAEPQSIAQPVGGDVGNVASDINSYVDQGIPQAAAEKLALRKLDKNDVEDKSYNEEITKLTTQATKLGNYLDQTKGLIEKSGETGGTFEGFQTQLLQSPILGDKEKYDARNYMESLAIDNIGTAKDISGTLGAITEREFSALIRKGVSVENTPSTNQDILAAQQAVRDRALEKTKFLQFAKQAGLQKSQADIVWSGYEAQVGLVKRDDKTGRLAPQPQNTWTKMLGQEAQQGQPPQLAAPPQGGMQQAAQKPSPTQFKDPDSYIAAVEAWEMQNG